MIIVYVICRNMREAKKIGRFMIKEDLAVCANMFKANSIFKWKGKIKEEKEVILLLKTVKTKLRKIETEVALMHSYEIPAIITMEAEASEEYEKWIKNPDKVKSIKSLT